MEDANSPFLLAWTLRMESSPVSRVAWQEGTVEVNSQGRRVGLGQLHGWF